MAAQWLLSLFVLPLDPQSEAVQSPRSGAQRSSSAQQLRQFDKLGSLLFMLVIGLLLVAVNRGNELGWSNPIIIGSAYSHAIRRSFLLHHGLHDVDPVGLRDLIAQRQ